MITTTRGLMDESLLEKKTGGDEDDEKTLSWIEYWFEGEIVHRSVAVHLKQGIDFGLEAASIV